VIDPVAAKIIERSGIKTVIVNGEKTENYHHKRNHRHLDTHIRPKSKNFDFVISIIIH